MESKNDDAKLWFVLFFFFCSPHPFFDPPFRSLGSSGSYDGSFQPLSLNNDLLGDGSFGSFGFGGVDMMDLGEDEESAGQSSSSSQVQFQQQRVVPEMVKQEPSQQGGTKRPRVCFPDHPGPVLPLLPRQAFDLPITPAMGGSKTSIEVLNKVCRCFFFLFCHLRGIQRFNSSKCLSV